MGKHGRMAGWEEDAIKQSLQKAAEAEQIPQSLHPKQMEAWLKEAVSQKGRPQADTEKRKAGNAPRKWHARRWWYGTAAAACLAAVLFVAGSSLGWRAGSSDRTAEEEIMESAEDASAEDCQDEAASAEDCQKETAVAENASAEDAPAEGEELIALEDDGSGQAANLLQEGEDYREVYRALCGIWEEMPSGGYRDYAVKGDVPAEEEQAMAEESVPADVDAEEPPDGDGAMTEAGEGLAGASDGDGAMTEAGEGLAGASDGDGAMAETGKAEVELSGEDEITAAGEGQPEADGGDYGKTNQQEKEIEEADIIKNDGRYLYHVACADYESGKETVQITDTEGDLKKAATVDGFEEGRIQELYVWQDTLVVIEEGWGEAAKDNEAQDSEAARDREAQGSGAVRDREAQDSEAARDREAQDSEAARDRETQDSGAGEGEDMVYEGYAVQFCRIHIYDIKDRTVPQKRKEFVIKGGYQNSRIADGYLYFFAGYDAFRPKQEQDYRAYIPEAGNKPLDACDIYLPQKMENTSYLVMASVNMEQPDGFTDTKAIVSPSENFYVTNENIYVANSHSIAYFAEGRQKDSTDIYRFSYKDGKIEKAAEGNVPGIVRDSFAINEHQGYLRMATTVQEETHEVVRDSISGDLITYDVTDEKTFNALYVLDQDLKVTGKIEGLAEGERIYSARFIGEMGYFATFRQTDPLFSVDLSDPRNPKVLGELKISGFSEYLHPYADHLLLGIGMEADEDTGITGGLKLTMFDTSDPADVKAETTLGLEGYSYANALYHYKAILIDPAKNLFGFCAEGYSEDDSYCRYLLFSYEDGAFQKRMEIDCQDLEMDDSASIRGTYIGDVFYLTYYSGKVEAYSLADGSKLGEIR